MQLNKKKELASRTLKVGKERVVFNRERLDEIKEAITKQDIKDLLESGAIFVEEITGSRKKNEKKTRRRAGSIKKKVKERKKEYMIIVRKLRKFAAELRAKKIINREEFWKIRKEIRMKNFKSKSQMKDRITQMVKERTEQ